MDRTQPRRHVENAAVAAGPRLELGPNDARTSAGAVVQASALVAWRRIGDVNP
jgi:hypothetical protein